MLFEACLIAVAIIAAGAMIAGSITSFTNNLKDIYCDLQSRHEPDVEQPAVKT